MKKVIYIFIVFILMLSSIKNVNALSLDCYNTLREGSSGSQVKNLQKMLNKVNSCNIKVTGKFMIVLIPVL